MSYKIPKYLLLFFLLPLLVSCKKNNPNPVPDVYVNLYLNITSTIYLELSSVGGFVNITGGYRGIVVYRVSSDEFVAFDRACPYDWQSDNGYVTVDTSGLTLTCAACGSQYLILDGSNVKGPSAIMLKQYRNDFDGNNLHLYN